MSRPFNFESDRLESYPIQSELENLEVDAKMAQALFYGYAPVIIADLQIKYPGSPTTKSVTCFLNKVMKSGADDRYLNRDRAQRIWYHDYYDFDTSGYVDHLKKDLLFAARWSKDFKDYYERVIRLDYAVRNGLARINSLYQIHGDTSFSARKMNDWAMALQARSNSIYSCYK